MIDIAPLVAHGLSAHNLCVGVEGLRILCTTYGGTSRPERQSQLLVVEGFKIRPEVRNNNWFCLYCDITSDILYLSMGYMYFHISDKRSKYLVKNTALI